MLKTLSHLCALAAMAVVATICPLTAHAATDPVRAELATRLVKAEGIEAQTSDALKDVMPLIMGAFKGEDAFKQYSPADMEKLEGFLHDALVDAVPELMSKYAEFYAQTLTEAQLKQLVAFYETPDGKAYSEARLKVAGSTAKDFELIGGRAGLTAVQKFLEWKSKQ